MRVYLQKLALKKIGKINMVRNITFKRLFELISKQERPLVIVETGTIRNEGDGDGHSTVGLSLFAKDNKDIEFYTVDNNPECIELSKRVVENRCGSIPDNVHFVESDGDKFLESFDKKIDVLYLDSANSEDITLDEYISSKHLLKDTSIVMIDDADRSNPDLNKWKKVVPQMQEDGWEIDMWVYQVILKKPETEKD
jgi:predicted O-methyltransferase YrrM